MAKSFAFQKQPPQANYHIGLDEVGRGAWAGPLVGAIVAVREEKIHKLINLGLKDSKKLTEKEREKLLPGIFSITENIYIEIISEKEIDKLGLGEANKKLFSLLAKKMTNFQGKLFVDGRIRFSSPLAYENVIDGDSRLPIIMAASIVAKVHRDNLMKKLSQKFPEYKFHLHKGYGTSLHREAILKFGICDLHRRSFRPIKELEESRKIA